MPQVQVPVHALAAIVAGQLQHGGLAAHIEQAAAASMLIVVAQHRCRQAAEIMSQIGTSTPAADGTTV
jgi:hypothetical protein